MVHIKRLDYFTRIFAFIGLVLHWFNPFVWLAFILSEKDMEMSCDEAVMKTLQQDHQVAYAETLLAIATGKKLGFVTPLAFGEGNPKARIKNILVYKKPALWVSVGAILVVCIVMISLVSRQGEEHNDIIADNMESSENTQFIDDSIDNFKENEEQELTESETEVAEQLNQVEADHQALLEQQNMMEEQQSLTHDKIAPNAQTFGNKSVYEELDCVKVIVKQQKEDVTSDGIKDYIETSFYVPGEDMKVLDLENINVDALSDDGHACFVAVYDGVDTVDWNHLGTLLWEHDFHMSHAGNGQISLVAYENQENPTPVESIAGVSGQETHENNLYTALLYTNIWFGQGNYDFYCQVFTLEADGTQNMLLEQHLEIATDENFHSAEYVDILMNEEKEEMITFQNAMYGWYDSAKAIVITDIMLENQMVSTDEKEYLAYPYYDAIFRYYLNDMEDMNMAYHTEITLEDTNTVLKLTAGTTYEYDEEILAVANCDVYLIIGNQETKIGSIYSLGTAYPISYDSTGIYTAGPREISRYQVMPIDNELVLMETAVEEYNEHGDVSYTYGSAEDDTVDASLQYQELREKYQRASVVNFK